MMLTVIRIRIYAIVVVISAVDAIAATAARDRKVHRVNQDRRVYREHPVRRDPLGLRDYKESPDRRAHLSQVIFYFMLMVTGDRSPSDLVKI